MRPSILLIDDNDDVRRVMRAALEHSGNDVCEAADGAEGLKALQQAHFDLVITDILMPEHDGLEMILHLRERSPQTPVIAISGSDHELYLSNARGLGATRVLQKPFRPAQLVVLVDELLGRGATRTQ
jgi:CheY-like chemotaxis protein